jgi:hypothetical protein
MRQSNKVIQKKRGRPATGNDPVRAIRLSDDFLATVDGWASSQEDHPGRSEAIRRLVEIGLRAEPVKRKRSPGQAAKAEKMAAGVVDKALAKQDARGHVKAQRRQELLEGQKRRRS